LLSDVNADNDSDTPDKSRLGFGIRPFPPKSLGDGSGSGIIPRIFFKKDPDCIESVRDLPVLHTSQKLELHRPYIYNQSSTRGDDEPVNVWLESRVLSVKPRGIGTFLTSETKFYQKENGVEVCVATSQMTALVLGLAQTLIREWGSLSKRRSGEATNSVKDTNNSVHVYRVPPNAALIYRLSGDYNPLHVEGGNNYIKDIAGESSKRGAVLHGLCTLGYAVRAVLKHAEEDPRFSSLKPRLLSVECSFVKPVFIGDSLTVVVSVESDVSFFSQRSLCLVFKVYRSLGEHSNPAGNNADFHAENELVVDQGVAVLSWDDDDGVKVKDMSNSTCISRL
jgi:acyl dehydratase